MKVSDLQGWPPTHDILTGKRMPDSAHVILNGTASSNRSWVRLTCASSERQTTFDFEAPDKTSARQLKDILIANKGKSMVEVGEVELPAE
jgi:hypothetical protein